MNLTVSLKKPLAAKYGDDGFAKIDAALARYAPAADETEVVYLDDETSMARLGMQPVLATNPGGLTPGIRQFGLKPAGDSLFIIGGDSILPHWQFQNPVSSRVADRDLLVYTDNPYGSTGDSLDDYLQPKIPVGRLADPDDGTAEDFVKSIDAVTANHRQRAARIGSAAVYNDQWRNDTMKVAAQLTAPIDMHASPGYQVTNGNRSDLNRRYLYFNLHGFAEDSAWKGFDPVTGQFFAALTPDSFDSSYISGSVVYAENCYGAWTVGKGPDNSCAMRLLDQGAAAVVGATGLAFGSYISPGMLLDNADELAQAFFALSRSGDSVGRALLEARNQFVAHNPSADAFMKKTLLQFILLGDPTLA
jgi:hypothetical protein